MHTLLLNSLIANDRVVDRNTSQVEVLSVVRRNEAICDVWDIKSSVRFSSDVGLPAVRVEGVYERLVEAAELVGQLNFVGDVRSTLRKPNTDRLLNPKHIGQVRPAVWVLHGS